ncbi:MAG: cobalamin biosynthesis protein [Clostridium sp.]|nr:cobalamin biosynthesis protein [Clostridium sp.]
MAGIRIISFTDRGRVTAERLREGLALAGYQAETDVFSELNVSLRRYTEKYFYEADALIFTGAAGIAVRAVAPWVRSKQTDPAVLCADEAGRFVIPLLSGHLGGANALAERCAEILHAVPVITTATDLRNAFAVDLFAKKNRLAILDMKAAKNISAAVLRGERAGFFSELAVTGEMPPELSPDEPQKYNIVIADGTGARGRAMLQKAEKDRESASGEEGCPREETLLVLAAQRAVLGMGCRKDADPEAVKRFAQTALREAGLSFLELAGIATIDMKKDEKGLRSLCSEWNLPLLTYSAGQLEELPGTYEDSDFVRGVTGTGNVCERAAVLGLKDCFPCGEEGEDLLILRKKAKNGVTAAIAAVGGVRGTRRVLHF